jgi:hypothetical protein
MGQHVPCARIVVGARLVEQGVLIRRHRVALSDMVSGSDGSCGHGRRRTPWPLGSPAGRTVRSDVSRPAALPEAAFDRKLRASDAALMHRIRFVAAPLAALSILIAACGGPSASALTDPEAILGAAVTTASTATSVHIDVAADGTFTADVTGTGTATPIQLDDTTATADLDAAGQALQATFSIPGLLGLGGEVIVVDDTVYYKTTLTGALYQTMPLDSAGTAIPSPDPSAAAEMLAQLDEFLAQPGVDPVKGADVDCGGKTCYTVAIELTPAELAALSGGAVPQPSGLPIPVPVDLADTSVALTFRVEQETTRLAGLDMVLGAGDAGELTINLTFSKWNEGVDIQAPPADQVQGAS